MATLPTVQLPDLATELVKVDTRIQKSAKALIQDMIEAGRMLTEAKAMLPHGQFESWVSENTGFSKMKTSRYMRAFKGKSNAALLLTGDETLTELVQLGSKPSKWSEPDRLYWVMVASYREAHDACVSAMRLIEEDTEMSSEEIQLHRVEFAKRMTALREDMYYLNIR